MKEWILLSFSNFSMSILVREYELKIGISFSIFTTYFYLAIIRTWWALESYWRIWFLLFLLSGLQELFLGFFLYICHFLLWSMITYHPLFSFGFRGKGCNSETFLHHRHFAFPMATNGNSIFLLSLLLLCLRHNHGKSARQK